MALHIRGRMKDCSVNQVRATGFPYGGRGVKSNPTLHHSKIISPRWINFTSVEGQNFTATRKQQQQQHRRLSSWHQVWSEFFNKTQMTLTIKKEINEYDYI